MLLDPVTLEDGQWPLKETHMVDLSGNKITSLRQDFLIEFANGHALKSLHLNDNMLTSLPPDIFHPLDGLLVLSLIHI